MRRRCVICGAEFDTPPSNNKITCSPACSRLRKSQSHKGKHNLWSEEAKASARAAAEKTGNLQHGTAAALRLPEGQRGPQNRNALIWHLTDPEGNPVTVVNLQDWARQHAQDYFGMEPTDRNASSIASGFHQIKRSMEGKLRRKNGAPVSLSTYKGWGLRAWEEKPSPPTQVRGLKPKVCCLCGVEFLPNSGNQKYCSDCAAKQKIKNHETYYAQNREKILAAAKESRGREEAKEESPITKRCCLCGAEFLPNRGKQKYCKSCAIKQGNESRKRYYEQNREKILAARAKNPSQNPEARKAYQAEYYAKNKERLQAQRKAKREQAKEDAEQRKNE